MAPNKVLCEVLVKITHNICFCGEIRKISCGYISYWEQWRNRKVSVSFSFGSLLTNPSYFVVI